MPGPSFWSFMKFIILIILSFVIIGCSREDQAGSVGSGAGIQEEEVHQRDAETGEVKEVERMDAGGEDLNITTPIYDRPAEEAER